MVLRCLGPASPAQELAGLQKAASPGGSCSGQSTHLVPQPMPLPMLLLGQTPERRSLKSELPWRLDAAQPSPLSLMPRGFNPGFSLSLVPGVCGAPNPLLLPPRTDVISHISNLLCDVTQASFSPWGEGTSCRNHGASNEASNLSSLPSKGHCVLPYRPSETQASLTASPNSGCGQPGGRHLPGPSCPWRISALCPSNPSPREEKLLFSEVQSVSELK